MGVQTDVLAHVAERVKTPARMVAVQDVTPLVSEVVSAILNNQS